MSKIKDQVFLEKRVEQSLETGCTYLEKAQGYTEEAAESVLSNTDIAIGAFQTAQTRLNELKEKFPSDEFAKVYEKIFGDISQNLGLTYWEVYIAKNALGHKDALDALSNACLYTHMAVHAYASSSTMEDVLGSVQDLITNVQELSEWLLSQDKITQAEHLLTVAFNSLELSDFGKFVQIPECVEKALGSCARKGDIYFDFAVDCAEKSDREKALYYYQKSLDHYAFYLDKATPQLDKEEVRQVEKAKQNAEERVGELKQQLEGKEEDAVQVSAVAKEVVQDKPAFGAVATVRQVVTQSKKTNTAKEKQTKAVVEEESLLDKILGEMNKYNSFKNYALAKSNRSQQPVMAPKNKVIEPRKGELVSNEPMEIETIQKNISNVEVAPSEPSRIYRGRYATTLPHFSPGDYVMNDRASLSDPLGSKKRKEKGDDKDEDLTINPQKKNKTLRWSDRVTVRAYDLDPIEKAEKSKRFIEIMRNEKKNYEEREKERRAEKIGVVNNIP